MDDSNTEKVIDLVDIANKVWAKRKMIIKWTAIGAVAGIIIAISKPNEYTAITIIVPEETNKNASSMNSLAGLMGVNLGDAKDGLTSKMYPQIVASTPFLLEFADIIVKPEKGDSILFHEYLLEEYRQPWWNYVLRSPFMLIGWIGSWGNDKVDVPFEKSQGQQEGFAGRLSSLLTVKSNGDEGTIQVTARMQDPIVAAVITDSLYAKLERYMNLYKTQKTRVSLEGNLVMMNQAKDKYYQLDSAYASAFDRNINLSSEKARMKIARLKDEKDLAFTIYQQLATQVETDRVKLLQETPIATILEPVSIPLTKSAPNVMVIIVLFAFLGGFFAVSKLVLIELLK